MKTRVLKNLFEKRLRKGVGNPVSYSFLCLKGVRADCHGIELQKLYVGDLSLNDNPTSTLFSNGSVFPNVITCSLHSLDDTIGDPFPVNIPEYTAKSDG